MPACASSNLLFGHPLYPCGHFVAAGWEECMYCSENPAIRKRYLLMLKRIEKEENEREAVIRERG
jgi:hypothetical protein